MHPTKEMSFQNGDEIETREEPLVFSVPFVFVMCWVSTRASVGLLNECVLLHAMDGTFYIYTILFDQNTTGTRTRLQSKQRTSLVHYFDPFQEDFLRF